MIKAGSRKISVFHFGGWFIVERLFCGRKAQALVIVFYQINMVH